MGPAVAKLGREPGLQRLDLAQVKSEPRDVGMGGDLLELVRGGPVCRPAGSEVVAGAVVTERGGFRRVRCPFYAFQHLVLPTAFWK
jgi:hypothetical protein